MRCLLALSLSLVLLGGLAGVATAQQASDEDDGPPSALDLLDEDGDPDDDATDDDPDDDADQLPPEETDEEPEQTDADVEPAGEPLDAPGRDVEVVERPDEQLVIIRMSVPELTLTRDMMGYYDQQSERLWLPLWFFVDLTELPVDVDIDQGRADGWIETQDQPFELDLVDNTVTVGDRTETLEADDAELHYDDIYVDIEHLARWFSFDWEFDFSLMELQLDPDPPFPPQQRIIRQQRREQMADLEIVDEPAHDVQPHPYQLWSRPVHEFDVGIGFPTSQQLDEEQHRRRTVPQANRYQIRGAGDLGYMNANWSIAGSERYPVRQTRLRFDRKDPDANLLGDAGATEIRAGDILSPTVPMVARTDQGRGVEVSSFPLSRPRAFDETTVSGPRQPGWEVELYRNDELIDFRDASDDDYYHFEDIPLLFGTNEIRVVQYGPHGQQHEDVYRYEVGPEMISPGEDHYRVSASQHNSEMIPITSGRHTTDIDGRPRATAEYERGLTERIAVAGRANTLPMRDGTQRVFSSLGVRNAFSRAYTSLDLLVSNGLGLHGAAQTRIGDLNVSAESAQFFGGFTSEQIPYRESPLRNRTQLRLNGVIPWLDSVRLPFSASIRNDYRSGLGNRLRLMSRLSAHFGGLSLIHNGRIRRTPEGRLSANGTMTVRHRRPRLTPRAALNYSSDRGIRAYRLGLDWGLRSDVEFRSSIIHDVGPRHDLTVRNGLHYRRDNFDLQGHIGLSHSGGASVGLGVSWGIGHNPETDRWEPTSERLTSAGRATPRVYWDKTNTGEFDEAVDEPLDNVEFAVNDSRREDAATTDDGTAVVTDLRPHEYSDIEIRRDSLPDPFLVPDPEGHSIVARPGTKPRLDFPVVMTGEIDGTIRMTTPADTRPAQNFTVELLDDDGEVVDEATTAFDGFYLFDFVEPGTYTVRPSPDQVAARNFEQPEPVEVDIDVEGTIVTGQNFELKRR